MRLVILVCGRETVKNSVMVLLLFVCVSRQKDEKQRLHMAKEELKSLNYHPLRPKESMTSVKDECEASIKAKKRKRRSKGTTKSSVLSTLDFDATCVTMLSSKGISC